MRLLFSFCLFIGVSLAFIVDCDPVPGKPANAPMGVGRGIFPGRVTWYYDRKGCSWDGTSKFFWDKDFLDQTVVDKLVQGTVTQVAGDDNPEGAWQKIFEYFNKVHSGTSVGYKSGEKIAIKINFNVDMDYQPKENSNTVTPQFLKAVIGELVHHAGVPQRDITIYDASRVFQVQYWEDPTGIGSEFPDVNVVDNKGGMKYAKQVEIDVDSKFYFSNTQVSAWNETKLPTCLTEAKYVIQLDAFRGHDLAGITESGKNWFGSIYRDVSCGTPGRWCPASLHQWVNITGEIVDMPGGWKPPRPMGVYNPLVDLLGHDDMAGKGLIFFSDGFYSGKGEQPDDIPLKFEKTPFNGDWSCSAFASLDPIALDSVLFDFLRSEKSQVYTMVGCTDNYLHEAALADAPPSKTKYAPSGRQLKSLGVHEHWNNDEDKKYSGNMGKTGIELVQVHNLE